MTLHSALENLFLKIFRNTVLFLMSIAIAAVPILLLTAAYKFFHSPAAAPATEVTLNKILSVDNLKQELLDEANKNNQRTAQEPPKAPAPQKNSNTNYKSQALEIYKCGDDYKKATGVNVEGSSTAQADQEVEFIRANIERLAYPASRGIAYVNGVAVFTCKVLRDPSIVALKKDGKIGAVLAPAIDRYTSAWDSAVVQNKKYQDSEIAQSELDKIEAVFILYVAGILFLSFMMLAIYLMLSRVENHIGGINDSLRTSVDGEGKNSA